MSDGLDEAREATVRFLDSARIDYLRSVTGASALKQYEQVGNRARTAARTSASVEEWTTAVLRGLRIASPSSFTSLAMRDLRDAVGDRVDDWLDMVEREIGFFQAEMQLRADERREARGVRVERTTHRGTGFQPAPQDAPSAEALAEMEQF